MRTPRPHSAPASARRRQAVASQRGDRGFILAAGLIFLVVVTLLSLSMFRSFGLQERIAGNTRDKQRAFEAAQSALQYGEWWLSQNTVGPGSTTCSGVVNGNTVTNMRICDAEILSPQLTSAWGARTEYTPLGMTVQGGGGLTSAGDINYQEKPALYISYFGLSPDGLSVIYQVTGRGLGGNSSTTAGEDIGTVSVVQSTYQLKADLAVKTLDGL